MNDQFELDISAAAPGLEPDERTYWENRGPHDWQPVTVRVRYSVVAGRVDPVLPHVRTVRLAPRNVLVERADGTRDVKPVRLLRCSRPG